MLAFRPMIHDAARYLEQHYTCRKHHVIHTGSNAYLLDFYLYLEEDEKGKELLFTLLDLIVENPDGGKVFYPGHLNPMNMSQNVIDTGTAVDAVARFAHEKRELFSKDEHEHIRGSLQEVVETYLAQAAHSKKITNQRLWGLTGVASYARYAGEGQKYQELAKESIEQAFRDMTSDGFFRYYPDPGKNLEQYDDITTFYQSRHTAFIVYVIAMLQINPLQFQEGIDASTRALLSMYTGSGAKDMRMECKRWYWLSEYEVASHSFDAYVLAYSHLESTEEALKNVLYTVRTHFNSGKLNAAKGINNNFQCPIFWTAHMAWLTRIENITSVFDNQTEITPFSYQFSGDEIVTHTTPDKRILVSKRFSKRNPTTGIYTNGIDAGHVEWGRLPALPHAYLFSIREVVNHAWYAFRGFRFIEGIARLWHFTLDSLAMLLPLYYVKYGKVESIHVSEKNIQVTVIPGSKFGSLLKEKEHSLTITL